MNAILEKRAENFREALTTHMTKVFGSPDKLMIDDVVARFKADMQLEENKRRAKADRHAQTVDMFE